MLKIKTTNDKLLGPLQQVTGIVERRHTLPILLETIAIRVDSWRSAGDRGGSLLENAHA